MTIFAQACEMLYDPSENDWFDSNRLLVFWHTTRYYMTPDMFRGYVLFDSHPHTLLTYPSHLCYVFIISSHIDHGILHYNFKYSLVFT